MISGPKPGEETTRLHFKYDAWNHLVKVQADDDGDPGDTIVEYQFDGSGCRIAKTVGETVTDYYYNEDGQVLQERTDGTASVEYLWDIRYSDAPVLRWRDADADPETGEGGLEEILYYCQDANFNTTALVDAATGDVVERYMYSAYGKATFLDGDWLPTEVEGADDGTASAYASEILFAGYARDAETGLYHTDAREYHCSLGRFMQADPAGDIDGSNLYQYCGSNPTNLTDPSGLEPDWEKVQRGIWGIFQGAMEFYAYMPSTSVSTGNIVMMGKGLGDFALGMNKVREGLKGNSDEDAPASVAQAVVDAISLGLTGQKNQTARNLIDMADAAFSGGAVAYARGAGRNWGPNTYRTTAPVSGRVRTNAQLVQEIGTRADAWATRKGLSGTSQQLGPAEHLYAKNLLNRYQRMFGDRGLVAERSFLNGVETKYGTPGSVRPDVLDINTGAVWDYKFGVSGLTAARQSQIMTHAPGVTSFTEVRP